MRERVRRSDAEVLAEVWRILTVCSRVERLDVVRREVRVEVAWAQTEALPSQCMSKGGIKVLRRLMGNDMEVRVSLLLRFAGVVFEVHLARA
jgi:hypothetical protein